MKHSTEEESFWQGVGLLRRGSWKKKEVNIACGVTGGASPGSANLAEVKARE